MTVSEVVLVVMTGQDILQRENEKSGTVHTCTEQPGQRQAQPAVEGSRDQGVQTERTGAARARLPDPEQTLRDLALRGRTLPTVPEQARWRV